jgi:hypothetical protein
MRIAKVKNCLILCNFSKYIYFEHNGMKQEQRGCIKLRLRLRLDQIDAAPCGSDNTVSNNATFQNKPVHRINIISAWKTNFISLLEILKFTFSLLQIIFWIGCQYRADLTHLMSSKICLILYEMIKNGIKLVQNKRNMVLNKALLWNSN